MSRPVWDSTQLPMEATNNARPPNNGASTTFKTNVNRQKTKRWVEAKTYSYDGDDWGEVDDYDEYRATPTSTQPTSKPTGLRQRGQSTTTPTPSQATEGPPGDIAIGPYAQPAVGMQPEITGRSSAGDMGPRQEAPLEPTRRHHSQEPAQRVGSYGSGPVSPIRSSSIGMMPAKEPSPTRDPYVDGHGRKASVPSPQGPMHQGTPSLQLDVPNTGPNQGMASQGPQQPSQPLYSPARMSSSSHSPERRSGSRPPVMPGAWNPADGIAYPAPPHDAPAPMARPASGAEGPSSFPPRKSSLTQAPSLPIDLTGPAPHSTTANSTSTAGEPSPTSRGARARSVSGSRQPPAFVRPADIYKRMEEERSRERRMSESTRRSMESVGSRPADADVPTTSSLDPRRSGESLRPGEEAEMPFRAKTRLDPVTERKSEYGLEGLLASNAQRTQGGFSQIPAGNGTAPNSLLLNNSGTDSSIAANTATPPLLPAVGRLSGFGDGIWAASRPGEAPSPTTEHAGPTSTAAPSAPDLTPVPSSADTTRESPAMALEHQPSMGFRSVVHQAFDQPSPPSATDSLQSTPTADPRRSNTTSTTGISPIISRAPTGNTGPIPAIAEEAPVTGIDPSLPRSSSPGVLTHAPASSSVHPGLSGAAEPPPQTIRLGHRRDLSTPSPNNSPARSPGLEANNKPLPEPDAAELAMTTPVEPPRQQIHDERSGPGVPVPSEGPHMTMREEGSPNQRTFNQDAGERQALDARMEPAATPTGQPTASTSAETNQSHNRRPSQSRSKASFSLLKNKVKDLAGRFDNSTQSKSARGDKGKPPPDDESQSTRPGAPPRDTSFRPTLPGGWVSYAPSVSGGTPPPTTDRSSTPPLSHPDINPNPQHLGTNPPAAGVADQSTSIPSGPANNSAQRASLEKEGRTLPPTAPERSEGVSSSQPDAPVEPSSEHHAKIKRLSGPLSIPPTPPPKDTPVTESSPGSQSNYFTTPLAPRRPPSDREPASTSLSPKLDLPPVLPPLSTDNSPHDQESDKLRKEIVKSLNFPELSATSAHPAQWEHYQPEPSQTLGVPPAGNSTRDSTVLPREYDSYWASMNDEQGAPAPKGLSSQPVAGSVEREKTSPDSPTRATGAANGETTDVPHPEYFPRPLSTAASKERPKADPPASAPKPVDLPMDSSNPSVTARSDTPVSPYVPTPEASSDRPSQEPQGPGPLEKLQAEQSRDSVSPAASQEMLSSHQQKPPFEPTDTTQPPEVVKVTRGQRPPDDITRPLSAAEIKAILEREEQQVGPTPPATADAATLQGSPSHTGSQPVRSSDVKEHRAPPAEIPPPPTYMPSESAAPRTDSARPSTDVEPPQRLSSGTVPPPHVASSTSTSPPPPALSFHDISALKTPAERIQAYQAARQHYAGRDTGLALWVARMRETSGVPTASSAPARSSADTPVRPLHSSLSPLDTSSGSGSNPNPPANNTPTSQQPYYQQYLQFSDAHAHHASSSSISAKPAGASPSTAAPPGAAPEGVSSPNTASERKLSRDQVQAKGKDLLHSAGVLGGRANVAAKGLFSKGKSRWRTSGGGGGGGGGGEH
ncbi:MAG: hypothetical protein M1823_004633 [Watsoniomyces obsoletus]|nr:MAG: hypothetical protein M1823_004633 [Watsoniomyces obsoletus]